MTDEEGVRSVQKHTIITDGDLLMRSTEVFMMRDQLMQMNDEYIAQKKKLERIKLEAQLLNAKAEEKLAEWKVKANTTPEVQEATKNYGRQHIAHLFPHKDTGDEDTYLTIISKQDDMMVKDKQRFDAVTDMMIKLDKSREANED